MLRYADGRYYVGSHRGEDPRAREAEHNAGHDPKAFTYKRRPVALAWAEHFDLITDAIAAERPVKGWSRAKKKRSSSQQPPAALILSLSRDEGGLRPLGSGLHPWTPARPLV